VQRLKTQRGEPVEAQRRAPSRSAMDRRYSARGSASPLRRVRGTMGSGNTSERGSRPSVRRDRWTSSQPQVSKAGIRPFRTLALADALKDLLAASHRERGAPRRVSLRPEQQSSRRRELAGCRDSSTSGIHGRWPGARLAVNGGERALSACTGVQARWRCPACRRAPDGLRLSDVRERARRASVARGRSRPRTARPRTCAWVRGRGGGAGAGGATAARARSARRR
jgi:hypothetical protein